MKSYEKYTVLGVKRKRLDNVVFFLFLFGITFAFINQSLNNHMTAHDLYTQSLSEYKSRLCSFPGLTLRSYCREYHVHYHGMTLWLSRHGIRIRDLKASNSTPLPECPQSSFSRLVPVPDSTARAESSSDMLYGVTITFPDGVIVSIKQGSSFSVHRFIHRYNHQIKEEQSCLR